MLEGAFRSRRSADVAHTNKKDFVCIGYIRHFLICQFLAARDSSPKFVYNRRQGVSQSVSQRQMLTDTAIKALKPASKDQWVCDGNGLYLRVRKTGRSGVFAKRDNPSVPLTLATNNPRLAACLTNPEVKSVTIANPPIPTGGL